MDFGNWVLGGFGIDLGTANTVVCHPSRGVILNEPSVIAVRLDGDRRMRPLAVGAEARELIGRTPAGVVTIRPLADGVVTDLESARTFMVTLLRRVPRRPWEYLRPQAVIGVPAGATALERRALLEAAEEAGLGHVRLLAEPVAGALGAGIDPLSRSAHLVVDVGGGTAEVTAICFGGILSSRSCRVAGDEMTLAVYQHLREHHRLLVGEVTAEDLKVRISSDGHGGVKVEGRDAASGRAAVVHVQREEVIEAVRPVAEHIVKALVDCLEELPPRAVGDVMREGIVAFGGGSLTAGFTELVEESFGLPVRVADAPLTCVAEGAARSLRDTRILASFAD
jgi:rod shape-determining protein MreB